MCAMAVSTLCGSTIATLSPGPMPFARSAFANRFDCSCSAAKLVMPVTRSPSVEMIAGSDPRARFETSTPMLYRGGIFQLNA